LAFLIVVAVVAALAGGIPSPASASAACWHLSSPLNMEWKRRSAPSRFRTSLQLCCGFGDYGLMNATGFACGSA